MSSREQGEDRGMITMFTDAYETAADGGASPPWDWQGPHSHLVRWAEENKISGAGRSAIVVGCGYADDAVFVASLGFRTTGFDAVPAALEAARRRYREVELDLRVADLFALPDEWIGAFDLVVESLTVQSIPRSLRESAIAAVAELVAPGGAAVVIASAREDEPERKGPPWPLDRAEIESFGSHGLEPIMIDRWPREDRPELSPWIAEFGR